MKKLILFLCMAGLFAIGNVYASDVGSAPPGKELVQLPVVSGYSYDIQSPVTVICQLTGLNVVSMLTVTPVSCAFIDRHRLKLNISQSLTSCVPKSKNYSYIDRHRLWNNNMPNINAVTLTGSLHSSIAFMDRHRRLQQNIA